jgi:hypothetical protein
MRPPGFAPARRSRSGVSRRGFLIGMSLVLVIALALVLYFTLFAGDRASDDPGAEAPPGDQVSRVDVHAGGGPAGTGWDPVQRTLRITAPVAGG